MFVAIVIAIALSLILGAIWGTFLPLSERVKGVAMAFGGGALISSLVIELYLPAMSVAGPLSASSVLMAGALVFSVIDHLVDEVWGDKSGMGLLAAITLDGIPENLALGATLVGASTGEVSAFAAAILFSNLPEAAGGAHNMFLNGWSKLRIMLYWGAAAIGLSSVTVAGKVFLADVDATTINLILSFAAGAVIASLVTEIFPQAYRRGYVLTGAASAFGVVCAAMLSN